MKTLIIQLARFGDIYLTWPLVQNLVAQGQEVHLLVRSSFKAATKGLPSAVHIHSLDSQKLMQLVDANDIDAAMSFMDETVHSLIDHKFDRILNCTFSPFSSYLTRSFEMAGINVVGYTRHADGYLNLQGDASAYFYAQVGVGRQNQIHVSDLFAMLAEVDLQNEDRRVLDVPECSDDVKSYLHGVEDVGYVVLHVGASDRGKALSANQLKSIVTEVLAETAWMVLLVGTESDRKISDQVKPKIGSWRVLDLCGHTQISDLFYVLKNAQALIGVDSSPIHIAALVNCPTLNLSCTNVCSYETGPKSEHSLVIHADQLHNLSPIAVVEQLNKLLSPNFVSGNRADKLCWSLVKSLYMGLPYPKKVFKKTGWVLSQVLDRVPSVIAAYEAPATAESRKVMADFDTLLESSAIADPFMRIFVDWFNAERIRIPPGDLSMVQARALTCVENLKWVLMDWADQLGEGVEFLDQRMDWSEQLDQVVKNFRFYNVERGMEELQNFLAENSYRLSLSGRGISTKALQGKIEEAVRASDYSCVADLLEYDLKPLMCGQDMIA